MVWDLLLQAAAGFILGAAAGYGVAAIVNALSITFAELWENLVADVQQIWGYVTEATQYCLASIAQILDNNWSEIKSYLRQEFGYRRDWLIAVFREAEEVFVVFVEPQSFQGASIPFSIKGVEGQVQLPTSQHPIVHEIAV
ncbi:MAG: hypothetical protein U7127_00305 [Phormidium sp.]